MKDKLKSEHIEKVLEDFHEKIGQWDAILKGTIATKDKEDFILDRYHEYEQYYLNYLFQTHNNQVAEIVWPLVYKWKIDWIRKLEYIDVPELKEFKTKKDKGLYLLLLQETGSLPGKKLTARERALMIAPYER